MTITLRHADILQNGDHVHITRTELTPTRPDPLHTHDFFELFWVQNGRVRHHVDGRIDVLSEGDLILIPPGPAHGVQAKGEFALIVALCLHPDIIDKLQNRHGSALPDLSTMQQRSLNSRDLAQLNQAALKLEQSSRSALATEAFILPILTDMAEGMTATDMPAWLSDALDDMTDPNTFQEGAAGLVKRTGRTHAHVSRSMRAFTGQSPSEYINGIRMRYAAQQLITDSDSIQDLAAQCGIPNMAHFHKLFRAHHGVTPLKYRQAYQRDIVQPKRAD